MRIWLRSSQLWVESLKLVWFFFQEISADQSVTSVSPEDRRCLFPEVLECNLKLSKCFVSFRRGNWAATMATLGEGEIEIAKSGIFLFSLQMFAWVQEQLRVKTEQHRLSALVRTVFQNMCQCSILTRFICHTLRYLPNTDTPMCDPWAAVQFNKHQCKFLE